LHDPDPPELPDEEEELEATHESISFVFAHALPPFSGSDTTCRILLFTPAPQELEQAVQELHSDI